MRDIDNNQDILDSRDIIEHLEELESDLSILQDDLDENSDELKSSAVEEIEYQIETLESEIEPLRDLVSEASASPDWAHGETLIRDSYFQEYAQELAEDCGLVDNTSRWPGSCIDWEQAARELQMDYMCVDFDGVEYWIRA